MSRNPPKGVQPTGFVRSNAERSARAAQRDEAIAQKLLFSGREDCSVPVVRLRYVHPEWSWRQVGEACGLTKDTAVARFRRLAVAYGLREPYPRYQGGRYDKYGRAS